MKIRFNKDYLKLFDALLEEDYLIIPREKYLTFIEQIEISMSINSYGYFSNHKLRIQYGRKIINKKQVWVLDIIIKTLIEKDILLVTSYEKNKNITRKYFYSDIFLYKLVFKEYTSKEEECDLKNIHKRNKPTNKSAKLQYDLLMSDRFNIDELEATKWIYNNSENENKIIIRNRSMYSILNKRIFSSIGDSSDRIYTNFTNLKKELRELCTIDGERLMSLDLKSSQPLIFISYLKEIEPNNDEVDRLYDIVINDDVYEWFLSKWTSYGHEKFMSFNEEKGYKEPRFIKNRDDAKEEFYRFLFKGVGAFVEVFQKEFPSILNKVNLIKEDLAMNLQKKEAKIFIGVCDQFVKLGCLSVHDSLYFKAGLEGRVRGALEKSFKNNNIHNYILN